MNAIVWWSAHSLVLPLEIGMGIELFQSCGHCWVFQICWCNECKTLMASSFKDLNSSAGISEKAMATHSSILAWKLPWTEEPGAVHGVTKSGTRLHFHFHFHFHALEKEMATHSSVLAWRIPGPGEPGGLPSMGSHRVGHNWSDAAAAFKYQNIITSCVNRILSSS